jgi:tryptophanase
VAEFGNALKRLGIPIQWPTGSHGVFVDARKFLPHIDKHFFPAQSLCAETYLRYGIRPVEIGLSLAGRDGKGIKIIPATDLVRFTVASRVLTSDHLNFAVEALAETYEHKEQIGGLIYNKEGLGNSHFTSTFEEVTPQQIPELMDMVLTDFRTPKMTYAQSYLPPNFL